MSALSTFAAVLPTGRESGTVEIMHGEREGVIGEVCRGGVCVLMALLGTGAFVSVLPRGESGILVIYGERDKERVLVRFTGSG